MLARVIESCQSALSYAEKKKALHGRVVVVTPTGDPIVDAATSWKAL
jgi:hypothetical protein